MQRPHHVCPVSRARTASPVAAGGRTSRASEPLYHSILFPRAPGFPGNKQRSAAAPAPRRMLPLSRSALSSFRAAFVFAVCACVTETGVCARADVFFPAVPRPSLTTTARSCAAAPPLLRPAIKSAPPYFVRRRAEMSGARATAEQVQRRTHAHEGFSSSS